MRKIGLSVGSWPTRFATVAFHRMEPPPPPRSHRKLVAHTSIFCPTMCCSVRLPATASSPVVSRRLPYRAPVSHRSRTTCHRQREAPVRCSSTRARQSEDRRISPVLADHLSSADLRRMDTATVHHGLAVLRTATRTAVHRAIQCRRH